MNGADRAVFYWINGWSDALAPFFVFFSEGTKWDWVRIALGLVVLTMLFMGSRMRKATILALLAWPLANGFTEALKTGIAFQRPCVQLPDVAMRVGELTTNGTASSHSANMAAVAFVFVYYTRWWGIPWVLVALFTGLSRIYVGVHYPSQVLFGWIAGIICALIVVKTWEAFVLLRSRRTMEHESVA